MKKIRIGCGAGCSYDRIEPAVELLDKGQLDYIVFECLAERTIIDNHIQKMQDPKKGYTPMLKERMLAILPLLKKYNTKLITNMGAANTIEAVNVIKDICDDLNITGLKIAYQLGDDITHELHKYEDELLIGEDKKVKDILEDVISANVYLGCEGIKEALDKGADIVITGRVADASLFVGPILHEFENAGPDMLAQATLLGHLLECGGQVTGGYYCDPGYKDVEGLARLGFPIGEIDEKGDVIITKPEGSGGEVTVRTCKEQLLYEITDPSAYITPNGVVDFSNVVMEQIDKDVVRVRGAKFKEVTRSYKVNIGFRDDYIGVGEISFGGNNSLELAKCCRDIVIERWRIRGIEPEQYKFSYIGYNSLYGDKISSELHGHKFSEIRLRLVVKDSNKHIVDEAIREIDYMYTNGPAGSSGITTSVKPNLGISSIIIPKGDIKPIIKYEVI